MEGKASFKPTRCCGVTATRAQKTTAAWIDGLKRKSSAATAWHLLMVTAFVCGRSWVFLSEVRALVCWPAICCPVDSQLLLEQLNLQKPFADEALRLEKRA